ncbi:MAG TPA: ABC transporter substrate-binding protein [Alphaproteobacteria bacterium]|nr:ABC transporter substrate-binding protein [Alphaproteobacteria bacterium]
MSDEKKNPNIDLVKSQLAEGQINRREFLRYATLLGMSASAAYAFAGKITGEGLVAPAQAQTALPKGGTLRIGSRIKEIKSPHTYSWGAWDSNISRQVCEYLTLTDEHNVTHPYLLEKWDTSPDLKTWTLHLRKNIKWHNGQPLTADDVIWNLKQCLDPEVGSSVIGLMKGYLLEEYDTGQKDEKGQPKKSTRLWDANAIQKIDDHTVRLNCKVPQVAVPEHLFHYPLAILYPGDKGVFGPGAQGTGAFELTDFQLGKRASLKAHKGYWGQGPHLDGIEFIDMGDDPSAAISAMASKQVHGLVIADPVQYDALKAMKFLKLYQVATAETAVLRVKVTEKPFDNPKVRKAMRLAVDQKHVVEAALRGLGVVGEHHHVSPVQPDYAKLPMFKRNVAEAKKLLAEAGFPNGIESTIYVPKDPPWNGAEVEAAVEQWKEAGIRLKINVMPGQEYWDVWTKVPVGCTIWYHRPLGVMVLGLAYRSGVPWNESGYSNPEFDKLLTEAEGTLDVAKRREIMAQLEKIMQEDGPIVQPIWRNNFTFYDQKVEGFTMHPTQYIFGNRLALKA